MRAIATDGPWCLRQHDTFFGCQSGRLKLRVFDDDSGELIFYQRAAAAAPAASFYRRVGTDEPDALAAALGAVCGVVGRVAKQRMLYKVGRTRIHLDRVTNLGDFMELEVVLADGEAEQSGFEQARALMQTLLIDPADCIDCAYIDLIAGASTG